MIERRLGHGIVSNVLQTPIIDTRTPQDPSLPMKVYIPLCIHTPTTNPATGTDAHGATVTGTEEPLLDTLIAIGNPPGQAELTAIVTVYNQSGVIQQWSGQNSKTITISPGHSNQFTFIPGNPFNDCPTNFKGYAVVQLSHIAGVIAALGGGGYWPAYWNTISAEISRFSDSPVSGYDLRVLASRSSFYWPYWIIWSDTADLNHYQDLAYRVWLILTNVDTQPCYAHIGMTIGDNYAGAGTTYSAPQLVPAGQSVDLDLYAFLKANAGYPTGVSFFEGNMQINLRATSNPADPLVSRQLIPHLLVLNRDAINPQSYQPTEKLQFGFAVPWI